MHFTLSLFHVFLFSALVCLVHSRRLASSGCSHNVDARLRPGGPSQSFHFWSPGGGGKREYLLHLPPDYKRGQPSPLILAFHGQDQTAATFEPDTRFSTSEHNTLNAIVAYPQGLGQKWNGVPKAPPTSEVNNMLFVGHLLDHLEATYCIANDRIYSAGFSNGGGLTDLLACSTTLSKRTAAFGASSAAIYKDSALEEPLFSHCPSRRAPVPFLEFHGTTDPVITYDGETPEGATYPVPETLKSWAEQNGCLPDAQNKTIQLHHGKVQKSSWTCGDFKDVVTHYRIVDMGHGWASTWPVDNDKLRHGPTLVDGTAIVMDFFAKWRLPADLLLDTHRDEL